MDGRQQHVQIPREIEGSSSRSAWCHKGVIP
jgi:hypothetical protein